VSAPRLEIRRARAGDAAALAAFAERSFRESYGPLNEAADVEQHVARHYGAERQAADIATPGISCLLALEDGVLVGFAVLAAGSTHAKVAAAQPCEIRRFYVDGNRHGRGVAPALMAAAAGEARAAGCTALWLTTWEHSARARAFYAKQGFEDVGTTTFLLGSSLQTDRLLVRPLE
jgi:ribosomal protein S18 acetylase RimI-like enzyme